MSRIGRKQFLVQLFWALVWTAAIVVAATVMDESRKNGAGIAAFIIFMVLGTRAAVFRLHDMGLRGWWLLTVIPTPLLFILRGTRGPNRFGPDPVGGPGGVADQDPMSPTTHAVMFGGGDSHDAGDIGVDVDMDIDA